MDVLRYVLPSPSNRKPVTRCRCGKATREGKPRCLDHVLEIPYAKHVAETAARRELEEEHARISADGLLAADVLSLLFCGPKSVAKIRTRLGSSPSALDGLLRSMRRRGLVLVENTTRGTPVWRLSSQGRDLFAMEVA